MFAGKGGVGKTTCAGATALHYALSGEPTLIISTDPTPSLSHIFEVKRTGKPVEVMKNLCLHELGTNEIKQMWDGKFGREVYEVFSSFVSVGYEEFVDFITSILPGMRDEFMVDYIREMSGDDRFRRIIWDTAPLGQTLGLLEMPSMLSQHLRPAPRIYSRLRLGSETRRSVLDILKGWEKISNADIEFLKNSVMFKIVTIPEALAVEQLEGLFSELNTYGFRVGGLIINNVIKDTGSEFLRAKSEQQKGYIEYIQTKYDDLGIIEVPLFPHEIKGVNRLKQVEERLFG